jgi:hypothetical protein
MRRSGSRDWCAFTFTQSAPSERRADCHVVMSVADTLRRQSAFNAAACLARGAKCASCGCFANPGAQSCSVCGRKHPPKTRRFTHAVWQRQQRAAFPASDVPEAAASVSIELVQPRQHQCPRNNSNSSSGNSSAVSTRIEIVHDEYWPSKAAAAIAHPPEPRYPAQHERVKCPSCGIWVAKWASSCVCSSRR